MEMTLSSSDLPLIKIIWKKNLWNQCVLIFFILLQCIFLAVNLNEHLSSITHRSYPPFSNIGVIVYSPYFYWILVFNAFFSLIFFILPVSFLKKYLLYFNLTILVFYFIFIGSGFAGLGVLFLSFSQSLYSYH